MININDSLVSVICLCYNHEKYVIECLDSTLQQTHKNLQIIIVDDLSTDNSVEVIEDWRSKQHQEFLFVKNIENKGHTKSFNLALAYAKGDYILDLAADDVLNANFIEKHLLNFKLNKKNKPGVSFCNVELIDGKGRHLNYHWPTNTKKSVTQSIDQGNIYAHLLEEYFINPTGMLTTKEVFDFLKGYDENLDFEDFDFWVRSSFRFDYIFANFIGIKKRIIDDSHSAKADTFRRNRSIKQHSIFKVCVKAYKQNHTKAHKRALHIRLIHELKIVLKKGHFSLTWKYFILYLKNLFLK